MSARELASGGSGDIADLECIFLLFLLIVKMKLLTTSVYFGLLILIIILCMSTHESFNLSGAFIDLATHGSL